MEQQTSQRQQLVAQQAQWQQPPPPPPPQQLPQVALAALAVAPPPLPPMPLPPAPAAQHVVQRPRPPQPLPLPAEDCDPASPGDASGSAKKRVRRTDWEGRKCAWCGVTETSNWRRHPEDRDMLLCNQVRAACGSRMEGDSAGGAEAVRGELTSRLPMGCSSASWSVQLRCCV